MGPRALQLPSSRTSTDRPTDRTMNSTPFTLPPSLPPTETLFYPAVSPASSEPPTYLLFLPGNPGLIEYYRPFLSTLSALLSRRINILGVSHAGFHTHQTTARPDAPGYWTLSEQIEQKVQLVEWLGRQDGDEDEDEDACVEGESTRVIIAGHSVGAFIALEVLRVLCEQRKKRRGSRGGGTEVIGGIMLFPTIVDIAKSPSGRLLSGLLSLTPSLPTIVSHLSTTLAILPRRLLYLLVLNITRQPRPAAATTLSFLTAPGAVFQALSLARDEMREITADRWSTDIWGSEKTGGSRLVFYFGRGDSWVADATRDAIIKARGRGRGEDWKPRMVVCESGVPHGFCIEHGEEMAEEVAAWVDGMLDR